MIRLLFKAYDRMKIVAAMPGGKVFIRGAGEQGKLLKEEFDLMGIPVAGFLDMNNRLVGDGVFHPDYVYRFPIDDIFIACSMASPESYASARLDMVEHGLVECVHFADFGVDGDQRMLRDIARPLLSVKKTFADRRDALLTNEHRFVFVPHNQPHQSVDYEKLHIADITVVPTTRCTLNCSYCLKCVSILKDSEIHYDYSPVDFISDLEKFLSVCSVRGVCFAGADIFMHPKVDEIFEHVSEINLDAVGSLLLFSNGVIIPKDKTLKIIADINKRKSFSVCLSNYGKHSKNNEALKGKLESYGIPHTIGNLSSKWSDLGNFTKDRNYSEKELRHLFSICECSLCTTLQDGRLYSCSLAAALSTGQSQSAGVEWCDIVLPDAYVDVRNEPINNLKDKVENYLYEIPYLNSCRYCGGMHPGAKQAIKGLQARRDKNLKNNSK